MEPELFEHLVGVNLIVGLGYEVREVVNETIKEPEDVVEACWAL
jgi:hypothetical protein